MGGGDEKLMEEPQKNIESIIKDNEDGLIMSSFSWWEKRRVLYNIIVFLAGTGGLLFSGYPMSLFDLVGIVLWAMIANLFFCLGFLLELFAKHYFRSIKQITMSRDSLFWIGTIFSAALTFVTPGILVFLFASQD